MGGSLLPLLALLGAAAAADPCARLNPCANGGTCSAVGSAWVCRCPGGWRGKRCQAGLGPAELTDSSPLGPLGTRSSGSWDPGPTPRAPPWPPSPAAFGAVEMPTGSTAAETTSEGGRRERAEPATPPGRTGRPPPATTSATRVPQAWLSSSTSPAGATGPGSRPSSPPGGLSTEGVTTSPLQGSGTEAEPTWGAGEATAASSLHQASSPRMQAEGARPSPRELPGPSPGQPVTGAPLPGSAKTPQEDDAALAEQTDNGGVAPPTVGPREFLWQHAGSKEYRESGRKLGLPTTSARHPEPWSAGGLLPKPPAPPRPSVGPELREKGVAPSDLPGGVGPAAASKASLGQRSSPWTWEEPALMPSPGVSPEAETLSLLLPSSSHTAAPSAQSPGVLPFRTGPAPDASQAGPSSSPPVTHEELPTGPTGETGTLGTGQDARRTNVALQTSTEPLTMPGTEPPRPPGAPNTHQATEPLSSRSSPVWVLHPLRWVTQEGTSSKLASSSSGTSAVGTERASDPPQRPPAATPQDSFPPEGASSQASPPAEETSATAAPTAPLTLTWRVPSPTESQASPAFITREDSAPTRSPFQTALFSSSTSAVAVPASQVGETQALGQFSATPARPWTWSRGAPSPGSPAREAPPSPPLPAAGTTRHTWPPARGDPPVASTWLLAVLPEATTQLPPATPREVRPRPQHVFVAENQPPVLKAAFLHIPWELVLAGSPHESEDQGLLLSINATIAPFFAPLPGFQRLEVKSVRPGGVVVLLDVVFRAEAPGWWAALNRLNLWKQPPPGLWVANTSLFEWSLALERPLDLCAELFSCPAGYDCVVGEDGHATCTSVCHRKYCKNQGICTHATNQTPVCQCPVGSDFWFLGVRCDYRVTQQGLLGVAGGLLLTLLLIGAAVFGLVVRRVRLLLLEARADQTKSSYRRFCRLDDVSAHYWSEPWLASVNSLDNPAFSDSEELLHLQVLETPHCNCPEGCPAAQGHHRKPFQGPPPRGAAGRPRSLCSWERSSGSGNEHMIDSGKASEVSVSSWPMEPIQWSPAPAPHQRPRQATHKSQRPHSYCEGMELVNLERSWTA